MKQSIIDRMFDIGTIEIGSAGTASVEVSFHGIPNPEQLRDTIRQLKDQVG